MKKRYEICFSYLFFFAVPPDGFRYAIHPDPRRKYFYMGGDCEKGGINTAATKGAFNACAIYSPSTSYWYIGAPDGLWCSDENMSYTRVGGHTENSLRCGNSSSILYNPASYGSGRIGAGRQMRSGGIISVLDIWQWEVTRDLILGTVLIVVGILALITKVWLRILEQRV